MSHPTNEVLAAKLDALRELVEIKFKNSMDHHKRTNGHLVQLNGQVAKNTEYRIKSIWIDRATGAGVAAIIAGIVTKLLN